MNKYLQYIVLPGRTERAKKKMKQSKESQKKVKFTF